MTRITLRLSRGDHQRHLRSSVASVIGISKCRPITEVTDDADVAELIDEAIMTDISDISGAPWHL
jgi:hypothetical protein